MEQTLRIYIRYTDPVNFERVSLHNDHIAVEKCVDGKQSIRVYQTQESHKWQN